MRRSRLFPPLLLALVLVTAVAAAAVSLTGAFDLSWYTIDSGGGGSSGGTLDVVGTIGQPDAGTMSGGTYTLEGGFWFAVEVCVGDANRDGIVNFADLLLVLAQWGECPPECPGDLDDDGDVDFADLLILLADWNCGVPGAAWPFEEGLADSGLDLGDWDRFMDVLEFESAAEQENWICWMRRYLASHEDGSPDCPDADPFAMGDPQR